MRRSRRCCFDLACFKLFFFFFSLLICITRPNYPSSCFKVAEEVSKNLASLKEVLSGTGDKEPQTEAVAQLAQELYNTNLLIALIANLQKIDFEVGERAGGTYFLFKVSFAET